MAFNYPVNLRIPFRIHITPLPTPPTSFPCVTPPRSHMTVPMFALAAAPRMIFHLSLRVAVTVIISGRAICSRSDNTSTRGERQTDTWRRTVGGSVHGGCLRWTPRCLRFNPSDRLERLERGIDHRSRGGQGKYGRTVRGWLGEVEVAFDLARSGLINR